MSDFHENELPALDKPRRKLKSLYLLGLVLIVIAIVAVVVNLRSTDNNGLDQGVSRPTDTETSYYSCPEGQKLVPDYPNTPAGGPMMTKCMTVEDYERQQDADWAANRQFVIDSNAKLQAGIDDLQAQFDAATTLGGKLSRVLTVYCHSDLKNDRFELVPSEKRSNNIEIYNTPPSTSSSNGITSSMESHYGRSGSYYEPPFALYGDFDKRAEQLWNSSWDAEAVNFALPASFDEVVVQMGCDNR